LVEVKPLSSR